MAMEATAVSIDHALLSLATTAASAASMNIGTKLVSAAAAACYGAPSALHGGLQGRVVLTEKRVVCG